jgi:hypothetical protein
VVHAISGTSNVDVLVDNLTVQAGLAYGAISPTTNISSGAHAIRINAFGTGNSLISVGQVFNGSASYTLVAGGNNTTATLLVLPNNITPSAGNVRIRFVDATPLSAAYDVYVTAPTTDISTGAVNPTLTGVSSDSVVPLPAELAAGNYRVRVTSTNTTTVVADSGASGTALASGKAYTVVFFGANMTGFPLQLILLTDN